MKKLFELIFNGHCHKWKIIEQRRMTANDEYDHSKIVYVGDKYILQCEKCGKITKYETS